jgi:tetratricopeptide (TPR) repeat protein
MKRELKPLSKGAVGAALDRALRYRLLNEPLLAESICLDILAVEPAHQEALRTMLLALTDQFQRQLGPHHQRAREVLPRLESAYERAYYEGIVWERRAQAYHSMAPPGWGELAYEGLQQAMSCYEKAIELRPADNDEAILRWNTCVRLLERFPEIKPAPRQRREFLLE